MIGGVMDRDLAGTLVELVGDLQAMDAVGAIELRTWPAAARLVELVGGWVFVLTERGQEVASNSGAEAP